MWTRFFPAVRHVRQLIKDGAIGEVHHVNADMGLCFPSDVERIWNRKMGGGGLLDIGVYPLAFVTMALGWKPQSVKAVGKLSEEGVDLCGSITLEYSQNRFGTVQYTCLANFSEEVTIIGSKGKIKIHPLAHTPTKITILRDGKADEIVFPVPTPAKNATSFNFSLSVGLFYEAQEVTKLLLDKKTQSSEFSLDESFALAQIMDDVRKQLGVVYDADFK
jgi:dihydrodiol dehydrogenase / D-xylose 1-dehydrogenase (NADP)